MIIEISKSLYVDVLTRVYFKKKHTLHGSIGKETRFVHERRDNGKIEVKIITPVLYYVGASRKRFA